MAELPSYFVQHIMLRIFQFGQRSGLVLALRNHVEVTKQEKNAHPIFEVRMKQTHQQQFEHHWQNHRTELPRELARYLAQLSIHTQSPLLHTQKGVNHKYGID